MSTRVTDIDRIRDIVREYLPPQALAKTESLLSRIEGDKKMHIRMLEDYMSWALSIHLHLDCAPFDQEKLRVVSERLKAIVPSPWPTR